MTSKRTGNLGVLKKSISFICTLGPIGYLPVAPGTGGALAAIPLGWFLAAFSKYILVAALLLLSISSVWIVSAYLKMSRDSDPKEVVIDEFVGCLVAIGFVPRTVLWVLAAFVVFRIFDIFKPWPVGWIDRYIKNALGVVGDDVVAGIMGGLLLLSVYYIL
jgi:phosphatidylglycerophosphatase A